jgi:hypothetical protein
VSEKVARIVRREANQAAVRASEALAPDIKVAIQNEYVTRQRVESLEKRVADLEAWASGNMSQWDKLKWLFRRSK